jgi:hypothetical protein
LQNGIESLRLNFLVRNEGRVAIITGRVGGLIVEVYSARQAAG